MNLKDKTVILTGTSSGIGLELAKHLDKEGAKLILVAKDIKQGFLGGKHEYILANLTTNEGIQKIKGCAANNNINIGSCPDKTLNFV